MADPTPTPATPASFSVNAGQALDILKDIVSDLESAQILDPVTGKWNVSNVTEDEAAFAVIENVLKAHGLQVPAKVDSIISLIEALLPVFVK